MSGSDLVVFGLLLVMLTSAGAVCTYVLAALVLDYLRRNGYFVRRGK